jgi:hypothetical protein
MVITGEVVVAIVVATERCTPVATSTEFKTRIKKLAFAKKQLFPFKRADPAASPHQPTKTYPLNITSSP